MVNGAKIEREFFEESGAETRVYTLTHGGPGDQVGGQVHCIICNIVIL